MMSFRHDPGRRSLASNLTVGLLIALACIAAMTLSLNAFLSARHTRRELALKADEYLNALTESLEIPIWNFDPEGIKVIGNAYARNDLVHELSITMLYQYGNADDSPVFTFERPDDPARLTRTVLITHEDQRIASLTLALSSRYYQRVNQRAFWSYTVTVGLMALALALVSSALFNRLLQRPFAHFIELVNAYAAGDEQAFSRSIVYREFHPLTAVLQRMGATMSAQMQKLRAAEQKYRDIVNHAVVGIFQTTPEGHILVANPALAGILGYDSAEDMMARVQDVQGQLYVHPERRAEFMQRVADEQHLSDFEVELYCQDGRVIWASIDARPVYDVDRRLHHYEGFLQDITARKQANVELRRYHEHLEDLVRDRTAALEEEVVERRHAEQALEAAKEEAVAALRATQEARQIAEHARQEAEAAQRASEEANRAKSVFLANMSHELRTPLNAILGFAQLLQRDSALTAAQRDKLRTILHSGEHLLILINDVLDMSKIEIGRLTLQITHFDLWYMLTGLEEMLRERVHKKGLTLTINRAPGVPRYIQADEGKIRQVLINLLGNAVKFTERGRVDMHVEIGGRADTANTMQLIFTVSDTGIGIAADEVETIFGAFERSQRLHAGIEGTGLGLAISRQIARAMGGDICVSSALGMGSRFSFGIFVGLSAPVQEERFVESSPPRVLGLTPEQPQYNILVVDDDPDSRAVLSELLTAVGFSVREAQNGHEAVEQYIAWQPHLIFMDMRMPVMNGCEAAQRIRELEAESPALKTRIIACTSSVLEEEKDESLTRGCDDFVRKPVTEHQIFETIRTYLGVTYEYAAEMPPAAGNTVQDAEKLSIAQFAAVPEDLLRDLEQAAMSGDLEMIERVADATRLQHPVLADLVVRMAREFQYKEIWTVIQQSKEQGARDA